MVFFRNPEIRKSLSVFLFVTALLSAAGFLLGRSLEEAYGDALFSLSYQELSLSASIAIVALLSGLLFTGLHLLFTRQRYRRIQKLSGDIDALLHGKDALQFSDYREGELAILKVELDKMVLMLREQSERLKQEKGHLAASMADISHQIRTPLTSIHLVLSLLAEPELSKEKRLELLKQMTLLLGRIDWLIEALLKISRLDAGTVVFQPETTPVSRVIQAAMEPLEIPMELRGQHFTFSGQNGQEEFVVDVAWTVEAVANI